MSTQNETAWVKTMTRLVNQSGQRVFALNELRTLLDNPHSRNSLPALKISLRAFHEILLSSGHLRQVDIKPASASSGYRVFPRYLWRDATGLDIALSLRKNSYLSHGTAARLHNLSNHEPHTIHVNKEQTSKTRPGLPLTQDAINRAFKNAPRTTQFIYKHAQDIFLLLNGKYTNNYEVYETSIAGHLIRLTGLERTLVDIADWN